MHHITLNFRKSTHSGGNNTGPNCVEVAFAKAEQSNGNGGNNCVEIGFAKAEQSNPSGNCVEVGFAKANQSGPNSDMCVEVGHAKAVQSAAAGHCVEPGMAHAGEGECDPATCTTPGIAPGQVVVRDSKSTEANPPVAVFDLEDWHAYIGRVFAGETDMDGDDYVIRDPRGTGIVLRFNTGEWEAFKAGCGDGQFIYQPVAA